MMAPMVAMKIPPRSNDSDLPETDEAAQKTADDRAGDANEDRDKDPPGSFPGMINFARAPAMRPKRIQEKMPMPSFRTIAVLERNDLAYGAKIEARVLIAGEKL
jgi:hypothetical protein